MLYFIRYFIEKFLRKLMRMQIRDLRLFRVRELLKEIKTGLYVTNTWYTRFTDYVEGEFSTIPRDAIHLIKNGEISKPVKDIRISDNMLNILKNIAVIGKDSQSIIGWDVEDPVVTPPVFVKNVRVTRSQTPMGAEKL